MRGERPDSGRPSVEEAIAVLRDAVDSPRAQAALKTLEGELEHRGPENRRPAPDNNNGSSRRGFPPKEDTAQEMGGESAKGDEHSLPPFERRQRRRARRDAKAHATAREGA